MLYNTVTIATPRCSIDALARRAAANPRNYTQRRSAASARRAAAAIGKVAGSGASWAKLAPSRETIYRPLVLPPPSFQSFRTFGVDEGVIVVVLPVTGNRSWSFLFSPSCPAGAIARK